MRDFGYRLNKRQKRQLCRNLLLMILTFFTLVCCLVAWFSATKQAHVNNMKMTVDRTDVRLLSQIEKIEFPCATNIGDCTKAEFQTKCAVEKLYYLNGTEPLHVEVECHGDGMLAYVCPTSSGDYFDTMMSELKAQINNTPSSWTFAQVQTALKKINDRRVGDNATFNGQACTAVRIIYWVGYTNGAQSKLENAEYWASEYVGPDSGESDYFAEITFTI